MILSGILGFIQDITCSVTGIIGEVLIMVMILIIMIPTRVRTIHTGQDSGHLIHITLTGEVLIIIIPAFTMEIQEGRMMYM